MVSENEHETRSTLEASQKEGCRIGNQAAKSETPTRKPGAANRKPRIGNRWALNQKPGGPQLETGLCHASQHGCRRWATTIDLASHGQVMPRMARPIWTWAGSACPTVP